MYNRKLGGIDDIEIRKRLDRLILEYLLERGYLDTTMKYLEDSDLAVRKYDN